jgi:triosephosphate isomerase
MRKQIAAANWKMNTTFSQAQELLNNILNENIRLTQHQEVIFAVPFPYLITANTMLADTVRFHTSAQNCYSKKSGAFTGEVSVEMLASIGVHYCIVGHSERREYFSESNEVLAQKINLCLEAGITPIFCCGEPLNIREAGTQDTYVEAQLKESLFHLDAAQLSRIVIAYEPIWAIGTGKTATTQQAQDMHAYLRSVLSRQFGDDTADSISILYGGSVKGANAAELFASPDVDGGLVGGASLNAKEFVTIMQALKR